MRLEVEIQIATKSPLKVKDLILLLFHRCDMLSFQRKELGKAQTAFFKQMKEEIMDVLFTFLLPG